jgi:hypothetical protein
MALMDSEYFAEFKTGVNNAWKVEQSTWKLLDGLLGDILATSIPLEAFRVAITVSAVTEHEDVVGDVFVNSEKISFDRATRLTNSLNLTSLPTITLSGLDCHILVECISTTGAPLYKETLKAIEIICFPKTHILRDPQGSGWMETNYDIWTEEPLSIGDQIRYTDPHQGGKTIDIYVKNVSSGVDLEDNSQPFRVLNCA